jgi:hypothetical protein
MLRPLVALALVLSTPAFAQTYDRTDIIRGLCCPDGCDEFAILAASPLTKGGEGTLLQTRVKTFHASSSGRRELSEENGYVYCSRGPCCMDRPEHAFGRILPEFKRCGRTSGVQARACGSGQQWRWPPPSGDADPSVSAVHPRSLV